MEFHIRRNDKEISDIGLLHRILKCAKYVTIALSKENQPYLVSLSHGFDENRKCIYFHCAKEGKKLDYMKSNNIVWGQAVLDYGYVQGECTHLYASVHFQGRISLISDPAEKRTAVECTIKQLDDNPKELISKLTAERLTNAAIDKIVILHTTGKKSKEVNLLEKLSKTSS